jgi:predicted PilT family ATPase
LRNVFVEGAPEKYQKAKDMIEEIIREHRRATDPIIHVGDTNPFVGNMEKLRVPDKYVGLIIGKSSENLKGIAQRSNTKIFVPQKKIQPEAEERIVEIVGDPHCIEIAKQEIMTVIQRVIESPSLLIAL